MSSDTPRVSVIIPAYNAEATLRAALQSVLGQTLRDIEVIVVDDCSTDSTAAVAERVAEQDSRVRLIKAPHNGGSSRTWNMGMAAATGEFLARCDADDTLPSDALQCLVAEADRLQADIVAGQFRCLDPEGWSSLKMPEKGGLNDLKVAVENFSLCGRLIRRSLVASGEIKPFDGLDRWDDLAMTARLLALEPKVAIISDIVYNYSVAPKGGSLSTDAKERVLHDHIAITAKLVEWFRSRGLDETFAPFLDRLKFCAKVKYMRGPRRDPERWLATFPEINSRIMQIKKVGWPYRFMFQSVAAMPVGLVKVLCRCAEAFSRE